MDSVVFLVAHPDDDTCNSGGLILKMKDKYDVHVICATRGERGVPGASIEETRAKRMAEHVNALAITGGTVHYLDILDGDMVADETAIARTLQLLKEINPRAVFTHWPMDSHPDHSATAELGLKACQRWGAPAELYYFEAWLGAQTTRFTPDIYVDVTDVWDRKVEAMRQHVCQNANDVLVVYQQAQNRFRGMECNLRYAEGYKVRVPITNRFRSILFEL